MDKKRLLSSATVALLVASRVVSASPAEAATNGNVPDQSSYGEAVPGGTVEELQQFLREFPNSEHLGPVFGQLVAHLEVRDCDDPNLFGSLGQEEWQRLCGCDTDELERLRLLEPEAWTRLCGGEIGAVEGIVDEGC